MRVQQTVPMTEQARIVQEAVAAERAAERKRRAAKRVDRVVGWLVTLLGVFMSGWLFMLAVGIARANWLTTLPTIDYGTSITLMSLLWGAWMFQSLYREFRKTDR